MALPSRRLPGAVIVTGTSMLPTLSPGDALLVRRRRRTRPGDLVVARFASRPELLVVKRAVREVDAGWALAAWEVAGDNPAGSDDSRTLGPAEVVAHVVLRYWPLPPSRLT